MAERIPSDAHARCPECGIARLIERDARGRAIFRRHAKAVDLLSTCPGSGWLVEDQDVLTDERARAVIAEERSKHGDLG